MFLHCLVGIALSDDQEDGVVTGYGCQYGGEGMLVDVIGNASRISWTGLDDGNIGREADGDESAAHLMLVMLAGGALVEGVVGEDVYVASILGGCLDNLKSLEVA